MVSKLIVFLPLIKFINMENLNITLWIALALLSFGLAYRKSALLKKISIFLAVVFTGIFLSYSIEEEIVRNYFMVLTFAILGLNLILSRFRWFSTSIMSLFPTLASLAFLYLIQFETITFQDSLIPWLGIKLFALAAFGILIFPLSFFISRQLKDFFGFHSCLPLTRVFEVLLIALGMFISMLLMNSLGVFIFALGYAIQSFYRKRVFDHRVFSILAFAIISSLAQSGEIQEINLLYGKSILGLLIGGAAAALMQITIGAGQRRLFLTIFSWLLISGLFIMILLLGYQKSDFGGMDAFLAIVSGFALVNLIMPQSLFASAIFATLMAIGTGLVSQTINHEAKNGTTISLPQNTVSNEGETKSEADIMSANGIPMNALSGKKTIDAANSQMTFKLGPKGGVTEGAFKSFKGTVDFSNPEQPKFRLTFPVKELTTFVSMRDESLMSEAYFNEKKYPKMTFESISIEQEGDAYSLKGNFTMIGKTNEEIIKLKYIGKSEDGKRDILVGKSNLDRTKYGMKADPMEGDIVDYQFKLELK